jgi:16S rRNA (guanine527-N7)-methyltransferase
VHDERLEAWLAAVVGIPGLTAIEDPGEARRVLLDDALAGVAHVRQFAGPIVDVGSGGGSPGIPLAAAFPERRVVLLEARRAKAAFLRDAATGFPNVEVVHGRAEEQPGGEFGVAVAKALAPPPVAAEWCLPLVRPGGGVVLRVGPSAERERVAIVAAKLGGTLAAAPSGFFVLRKTEPTPAGFPRRSGMARKRPLA